MVQSGSKYRLFFNSLPGRYMVISKDFIIENATDAFFDGVKLKRAEIIGRNLFDVFPRDPNLPGECMLRASLERVKATKQPDKMSIQRFDVRRPDGTLEETHWSPQNLPVLDESGELEYFIHSVEDVTDLVKAEKNSRVDRMEAMGQLAGGVAHDFNNILATIILTCESALEQELLAEYTKESLKQVLDCSRRAGALTRQLLAFSRKQVLQPEVMNINNVINEIRALLGSLVPAHTLTIDLAADLGNSLIDSGQVEQALMNLIVNARDAMSKGGSIQVKTENVTLKRPVVSGDLRIEPGNYIALSVSDSGIGMDEATRKRIFEPFFTTKEKGRGAGLGLSTVYGIVRQNRGGLEVTSSPGKGSTFKLYFPFVSEPVAKNAVSAEARPITTAITKKNILVVEDEPTLRNSICEALRKSGYVVYEAGNGIEALACVEKNRDSIDLIVSDVVMPQMGGPALAQRLSEMGIDIQILFLSGYSEDILKKQGVSGPQPEFLEKPFNVRKFLAKVGSLVEHLRPAPTKRSS